MKLIGVASMRQEEAIASSWIFRLINDFASCFASVNKKIIQIPINHHKLVFVLQRYTTKTH